MACPFGYFGYFAQIGDTYASIAGKFSVDENELKQFNGSDALTQGKKIKIPCRYGGCGRGAFYIIRRNDTICRIAKRGGICAQALLEANPYLNPSYYLPGQVIVVPYAKQLLARYTLGKDERLIDVLRKYDMDLSTFCALNPNISPLNLKDGQRVNVKKASGFAGFHYAMLPGDSIASIAAKFGISVGSLFGANRDMKPGDFLPGVRLRIPGR